MQAEGTAPVRFARVEGAQQTDALLSDARLVELDGSDHFVRTGDVAAWVDEARDLLAGA